MWWWIPGVYLGICSSCMWCMASMILYFYTVINNQNWKSKISFTINLFTDETSKPDDGARKKRVFKTKKQYEAEAQFKFFCQNCSFKSKRESHFRKHLELHDKISDIFVCKLCGFKTIRQSTLRKHEISHSVNVVKCKLCSYVTDLDTLLRRHMNLKHNNRKRHYKRDKNQTYSYRCAHCGQTLPTLSKYRLHLKMHNSDADTEEFAFHCDQCDYKTKRKEHINRHRMNHTNDRPHLCDTCGMTFKRSDTLNQHKQVHLEKMQRKLDFVCQVCNKAFRSKVREMLPGNGVWGFCKAAMSCGILHRRVL